MAHTVQSRSQLFEGEELTHTRTRRAMSYTLYPFGPPQVRSNQPWTPMDAEYPQQLTDPLSFLAMHPAPGTGLQPPQQQRQQLVGSMWPPTQSHPQRWDEQQQMQSIGGMGASPPQQSCSSLLPDACADSQCLKHVGRPITPHEHHPDSRNKRAPIPTAPVGHIGSWPPECRANESKTGLKLNCSSCPYIREQKKGRGCVYANHCRGHLDKNNGGPLGAMKRKHHRKRAATTGVEGVDTVVEGLETKSPNRARIAQEDTFVPHEPEWPPTNPGVHDLAQFTTLDRVHTDNLRPCTDTKWSSVLFLQGNANLNACVCATTMEGGCGVVKYDCRGKGGGVGILKALALASTSVTGMVILERCARVAPTVQSVVGGAVGEVLLKKMFEKVRRVHTFGGYDGHPERAGDPSYVAEIAEDSTQMTLTDLVNPAVGTNDTRGAKVPWSPSVMLFGTELPSGKHAVVGENFHNSVARVYGEGVAETAPLDPKRTTDLLSRTATQVQGRNMWATAGSFIWQRGGAGAPMHKDTSSTTLIKAIDNRWDLQLKESMTALHRNVRMVADNSVHAAEAGTKEPREQKEDTGVGIANISHFHSHAIGLLLMPHDPNGPGDPDQCYATIRNNSQHSKFFWVCNPWYTNSARRLHQQHNIYGWLRWCNRVWRNTYVEAVCGGSGLGTPDEFSNNKGMPWPTLYQWRMLSEWFHVPTCFHEVKPGDVYYILPGTFHLVRNSEGVTLSCAWDTAQPYGPHRITLITTTTLTTTTTLEIS
jgi:hypothetical protein